LSQILVDDQKENRDRDGAVSGTLLAELIQRGGDALYSLVRRGVGDVETNLNEMRDNVKRWMKTPGEVSRFDTADLRETVHSAVERVLRVADLPTRGDLEALNKNLERLATALESFEARLSAVDAKRDRAP
jgi:BMFP domain-containing protein YqiC